MQLSNQSLLSSKHWDEIFCDKLQLLFSLHRDQQSFHECKPLSFLDRLIQKDWDEKKLLLSKLHSILHDGCHYCSQQEPVYNLRKLNYRRKIIFLSKNQIFTANEENRIMY